MDQDRYRQIFEEKALMSGGLRLGGVGKYRTCVKHYEEGNDFGRKPGKCMKYAHNPGVAQPVRTAKQIDAAKCNPWLLFLKDYRKKHADKNWTGPEMISNASAEYPAYKLAYANKANRCRAKAGLPKLSTHGL